MKLFLLAFLAAGTAASQTENGVSDKQVTFHINQFLVHGRGQGPRSRTSLTAPSMWELEFNNKITPRNSLTLQLGLTWDKWAMPSTGNPQLLQTGDMTSKGFKFTDAQHPHTSPVANLTLSDIISLSKDRTLTFFFAPRGEATAGPENAMHRESGEINPDAPLSHHLQDYFHLSSTVVGARYKTTKTSLEASVFYGTEPDPVEVNLNMRKPNSLGIRLNRDLGKGVSVGGSYANLKSQHRQPDGSFGNPEKELAYSSWITTTNLIKSGKLSTAFIWGQVQDRGENLTLNSYLEEMVYQLGKSKFFGRLEVLQRTPEQLDITVVDGQTGARWVKPVTVGYARSIYQANGLNMDLGVALTKNYLPSEFKGQYGGNPGAGRLFLKLNWGRTIQR